MIKARQNGKLRFPPQIVTIWEVEFFILKFLILNKFFQNLGRGSKQMFELCRSTIGQNLALVHSFKNNFLVFSKILIFGDFVPKYGEN